MENKKWENIKKIGNIESLKKWKIGNMENVKKDNKNKRESIVRGGGGGGGVKTRKGIQWNSVVNLHYFF